MSATEATSLHHQFITHGRILRAWSPRTAETYQHCLLAFGNTPLTKAGLAARVVALRERGHTLRRFSTGENVMIQHTTHVCLDNDYEEGEPTRIDISDAGLEANLLFSVVVGDKEADLLSLNLSIRSAYYQRSNRHARES